MDKKHVAKQLRGNMENFNHAETNSTKTTDQEVASKLKEAKAFTQTLNLEEIKSGQWFILLLQKVAQSYDRNTTAEYFQQKYSDYIYL